MEASEPPATMMSARAGLEVLVRAGDRLGAGGAGRHDGLDAGARAEVHADRGRGSVGHEHGHRHGEDPAGALLAERVPGGEERPHAADAGRPVHGEAQRVDLGGAGVGPRLTGGRERELARRVEALGLDPLHDLGGRHLGLSGEGDGDLPLGDPVLLQRADARLAAEERLPGVLGGAAERRRRADAGDDDLLGGGHAWRLLDVGNGGGRWPAPWSGPAMLRAVRTARW